MNPTVIHCELKSRKEELSSSPWFYDALSELLSDWATDGRYGKEKVLPITVEAGNVYEWVGTFRNYRFIGNIRKMTLI